MPSLLLDERLLTLGRSRWFAVALADVTGPPLPDGAGAYAYLRRADGTDVDLIELVRWRVPAERVLAELRRLLPQVQSDGAAVRARYEHAARALPEACWLPPVAALALDERHVLLSYAGMGLQPQLRVIDVDQASVRFEQSADAAFPGTRPELQLFPGQPLIEQIALVDACAGHALLQFRGRRALVYWTGETLQVLWNIDNDGSAVGLMPAALVHGMYAPDAAEFVVRSLSDLAEIASFTAEQPGLPVSLSCAHLAKRFAIGHVGGIVEVADLEERSSMALRPFPLEEMANEPQLRMSLQGHHLLVIGGAAVAVVDLESARAFDHPLAGIDPIDADRYAPMPGYRGALAVGDDELGVLWRGVLQTTPYANAAWRLVGLAL